MDALKFILNDIERSRKSSPLMRAIFLLGLFLLPLVLGLGLRDSTEGAFRAETFVPNLIAALLLLVAPTLYLVKRKLSARIEAIILFTGLLSLTFAMKRIFFPGGDITTYPDFNTFVHETSMCFSKGSFSALLVGIWITYFSFTLSAWPTRAWRFFLSMVAGLSGAVMLGFHCDSSSMAHVMYGHVLPGFIFGGIIFLIQEFLFKKKLQKEFPDSGNLF